eukprot:1924214-Rhodomonas_salina.8
MDPANSREALIEAHLDASEGADMLMVKPVLRPLVVPLPPSHYRLRTIAYASAAVCYGRPRCSPLPPTRYRLCQDLLRRVQYWLGQLRYVLCATRACYAESGTDGGYGGTGHAVPGHH